MQKTLLMMTICLLQGCVGLAVGTYGTFEADYDSFSIGNQRNELAYRTEEKSLTKSLLVSSWGEPDEILRLGNCEVLSYYDGYTWSGAGAFIVFVPVPLIVPTGRDENRFYFVEGESVGLVTEYGEVSGALGYMCGSNECKWLAGPVNRPRSVAVESTWCN